MSRGRLTNNITSVSKVKSTTTANKDGTVTIASTELTATFSTKKDGTFLGATTQPSTITLDPKKNGWDYLPSRQEKGPVHQVSFVDAATGFRSAGVMLSSVQMAAHPDALTLLPGTVGRDMKQHPGKYLAAAAGVASGGSALAGWATAAAALTAISTAAGLYDEVTNLH